MTAHWTAATVFQNKADSDLATICLEMAETDNTSRLRAQLELDDAEVAVTVSRLTVQKGRPTFLDATRIVHEARPSVRFLLVGPRESEGPFAVDQALIERPAPYVIARGGIPRVLLKAGLAGLPT